MKETEARSIFAPVSQPRLILELPLGYKRLRRELSDSNLVPSDRQITLAQMLIELSSLYQQINEIRKEAKLNDLMPYPSSRMAKNMMSEVDKLTDFQHSTTVAGAQRILKRYNLPEEWLSPVHIAILTHHLYIPNDSRPRILWPNLDDSTPIARLNNVMRWGVADRESILIEIPAKSSIDEVQNLIIQNKAKLNASMERLKAPYKPKIEFRTLYIGDIVRLIRIDGPKTTWPQTLTMLEIIWEKLVAPKPRLPDSPDELRIMYQRYLNAFEYLEKNSKP